MLLIDRTPGQPPLDDHHRCAAFGLFLRTLQSPRPPNTDELFYCVVRVTVVFQINIYTSKNKCTHSGPMCFLV